MDVLEPDEFFERVKKLNDDNSPMNEFIKHAIGYESDHRKLLDNPPAFYVPFLRGKKDITWSKKLARFIPDVYPSKIIPSWDILRKDLALAKKTGIFDKYKINYSK